MRRWQLVFAIGGVPLLAVGAYWRLESERSALFLRVERRLESNTTPVEAALREWFAERQFDANTVVEDAAAHDLTPIAARPTPRTTTPEFSSGPRDVNRARLARVLTALARGHDYGGAWIVGADLRPVAANDGAPELNAIELACAREVLSRARATACGPYRERDQFGVDIVTPLLAPLSGAGGVSPVAGVVILRRDPRGHLLTIAAPEVRGSATEQSRLMARVGSELVVVSSSRHPSAGPLELRVPWSQAPEPIRRAIAGVNFTGAYTDFSGAAVVGSMRHVAGTPWVIVRQVESAEILGALHLQLRSEAMLAAALLALIVLGAIIPSRVERSRRLRDVAASEQRLASTLASAFDAIVTFDERGRITLFNAAAERMFGLTAAEAIGTSAADLTPKRLRDVYRKHFRDFVSGNRQALSLPAGPELVGMRSNGEEFRLEIALSRGYAEQRPIFTMIVRDVTERRAAEEALRKSEASARSFIDHSPYGICRTAPDGRFLSVNPALVHLLGAGSAEELLRLTSADVGLSLFPTVGARGAEQRITRRDGAELVVRVATRAVAIGEDGAGSHLESFIEDVTPLRSAEHALRHAEKLAAVGRVVSGVAHELNNPLGAILLLVEDLLESDLPPDERDSLTLVRDQARRSRSIVRDLLAFVRRRETRHEHVAAAETIEHIARALSPQVIALGARFESDVDRALGTIAVDAAAIEQVLTNIVVNAAQAAGVGGTVRMTARRIADAITNGDSRVIVEVEDDGPGIPNDVLPRLFEPFFTTKPVGAGTGLGLSVSLGIVEQHGGTLRAENRAGGQSGARFVVELPAFDADPSLPDRDDAVPMDQREMQIPSTSAPRVLVVDDESPIRHALRRFFVKRNWLVDEAEDGGAALHAIQSAPSSDHYALVISDLRMPGVSGIELHDRLAMAHPSMLDRVIFTTGDVVSAEAAEFVARTTCVVLEKPFEFSALDDMIRRAETED